MSQTLPENILREYKTDVFFETGTYLGGGVELALRVGFNEIHSIELDTTKYNNCKEKFKDNSEVRLYNGSSEDLLTDIYNSIVPEKQILFWLDAHTPELPLYSELEQISKFNRKDHTILIDDLRCFTDLDPGLLKTKQYLLAINPEYKIFKVNSSHFRDDILVATLK